MSSSKVFKEDPHFTPTPLVRRSIEPVVAQEKRSAGDEVLTPANAFGSTIPETKEEPQASAPCIDVEAIRREAYSQGMADLAAELQMDMHNAVAAFTEACQQIDQLRATLLHRSRGDLINLIILLTQKIIGQELATPRGVIASTLQSALEQAIESEEYQVRLHPADLACAEAKVPELISAIRGLQRIVFKTDETMSRGGCLLESSVCTIDATIETQLESLRELLTEQPLTMPADETEADADAPAPETTEPEPPHE